MGNVLRGLVGFGMSAALIGGGAAALHKWEEEWTGIHKAEAIEATRVETAKACQDVANLGKEACHGVLVVSGSELKPRNVQHDSAQNAYLALAIGGFVIGGVGAAASVVETLGFTPDVRRVIEELE